MADITKQLADALRKLEQWVSEAADEDGASFDWHAINADEGAQARAALAAHDAEQAAQAVPAGFKLAPHYRGYALLGTGRYLIDSTDAPADPELGAELIISIASEKDREGREIGERRDMPARTIQPDDMAVRIGFANERGLFALEDQLWTLRQEHWPGTQSAAMLAAAPAAPAPEAQQALASDWSWTTVRMELEASGRDDLSAWVASQLSTQAQQAAGQAQDERAAFEAWARTYSTLPITHDAMFPHSYEDMGQAMLWDAWQARAALAQRREPLQDSTLWGMWVDSPSDVLAFARRIERHYGIGATTGEQR